MKRGRPKAAGRVFYLGRLRVVPGRDPAELVAFLEALEEVGPGQRRAMLKAALIGGLEGGEAVHRVEDRETTELLEGLLEDF